MKQSIISIFFCRFFPPSYYVNGRDTSLEDFLDPDVLDLLATKTQEVLEVKIEPLNMHNIPPL